MIILKELRWDNCFSYGPNNVLNLCNSTVTQLVGLNGHGKSSIPLILEEVLFNKNSKNIKKADIENRKIKDGYTISLDFSVDQDEFNVTVTRKKGSVKVILTKNGEDISSHTATNTYKTLEKILGMDFKTFSQLVYQNTNSSLQFLTATDTVRKKFLISLFSLEDYLKLFDVFKEVHKELKTSYDKTSGKIETTKAWLEKTKSTDTKPKTPKNVPNRPEEEEEELRSIMARLQNLAEKNKRIEQNNKYKELLRAIPIQQLQSEDTTELGLHEELAALAEVKAELKSAKDLLKKHKDAPNKCHACGQSLDNSKSLEIVEITKKEIKRLEEKQLILDEKINAAREENNRRKHIKEKIKEWEDLFSRIDNSLPDEAENAEDYEIKSRELRRIIAEVSKERDKIVQYNSEVSSHNKKIELILEQRSEYENELKTLSTSADKLLTDLSAVEVLKKAFSTNGLIAYKLENLVKELEELTNTYLAELSDGRFTIEFVINADKLNVIITDNGREVDILALSSGELARVNTATLIAIRKLMSSISKSKINVLFLDEVVSVLDERGKETLVDVLINEEDLNSYIVSHGWTHPLLEKIQIIKENDISRLE